MPSRRHRSLDGDFATVRELPTRRSDLGSCEVKKLGRVTDLTLAVRPDLRNPGYALCTHWPLSSNLTETLLLLREARLSSASGAHTTLPSLSAFLVPT